jgi:hypothetical protein
MSTGASCTVSAMHLNGRRVAMIPFRARAGRRAASRPCGDCGVAAGGFHHLGCDMQRFPLCRGQMITCGCRFDEDGPAELDHEEDDDEPYELLGVDSDGVLVERAWMGGHDVIVHYDDLPESDITVLNGVRVTTPFER